MSSPACIPLVDASTRVLPDLLDFHAENNTTLPWAVYPTSDTTTGSISFSELANTTHRVAHSLRPQGPSADRDVVVMLLHCDTVLYVTMLIAICRAGMVPFPVSPRNSPEAITNLVVKTSCRRVLTQPSLLQLLSDAQNVLANDGFTLQVDELPNISTVYPGLGTDNAPTATTDSPRYPASSEFEGTDLALYMHSAGSTGLPKPIPVTQRILTQWVQSSFFTGSQKYGVRWAAMALPTFHTMGILAHILAPLVTASPAAMYEPRSPSPPVMPNPQNVIDGARLCKANGILTVPTFVELWAQSDSTVRFLSSLKLVIFGGGPMSAENGDKLVAAGVRLVSAYGTTETGPVAHVFDGFDPSPSDVNAKTAQDWQWQSLPPSTKPRWVPQGDGTYELQFLTCDTHHPSVENIADVKGYATSDLWRPHPSKKGLWQIVGRKDDVIVLGSGEKIVPVPQERHIASHPLVADAVMFGRAKLQAGVLVDPAPQHHVDPNDKEAVSRYIDEIWPYVDQANAGAPAFARVFREMIILTDPAKPLPRAAKGNVIRSLAVNLYADAIEGLYETAKTDGTSNSVGAPKAWDRDELGLWLLSLSAVVNHGVALQPSVDMFEQGFDSLHATFLRNHIVNALRASGDENSQAAAARVDLNIVYTYPTIRQLAAAIVSIISTKAVTSHSTPLAQSIDSLVAKYSANLAISDTPANASTNDVVVFLTGSTGSLGSHILALLLATTKVSKVYTFNRASKTDTDRHVTSFDDRGLPTNLLDSKKHIALYGDLSQDCFGLSRNVVDEMASSVTHVVHNAWRVDFNHSLDSFESQIAGTRKLLDFCLSIKRPVRMLYTSSISVAHSWPTGSGLVPEEPLTNSALATDSGYSASKYVVEQMLSQAHEGGFEATSLRVGQVCGSGTSGAWNTTEWVPILIKSALTMGCLPDLDGLVAWIPVDTVGNVFVDLLFSSRKLPRVVNVVHPRPTTWKQIADSLAEALQSPLPLVPLPEWLSKIEMLAANAGKDDMERTPAIKLLSFFRTSSMQNPVKFATAKVEGLSQSIRILEPLGETQVEMWVNHWKKKAFL